MTGKSEADAKGKQRIQEAAQKLGPPEVPPEIGLFERTERPPLAEVEEAGGKPARKSRAYDKAHPTYAFRIRPEDSERLNALAGELSVTRDALARGLVRVVLDAVQEGRLTLAVEHEPVQRRDTLGRLRSHVRSSIAGTWANPAVKPNPQHKRTIDGA